MSAPHNAQGLFDEIVQGLDVVLRSRTLPEDLHRELQNLLDKLLSLPADKLTHYALSDLYERLRPLFGEQSVAFYTEMVERALCPAVPGHKKSFVEYMADFLRTEIMKQPDPQTALSKLRGFVGGLRFARAEYHFRPIEARHQARRSVESQVAQAWQEAEDLVRARRKREPRSGEVVATVADKLGVSERTVRRRMPASERLAK